MVILHLYALNLDSKLNNKIYNDYFSFICFELGKEIK